MPQNEYIERFTKQHGKRFDHDERQRKKIAREGHNASKKAQNFRGLRAKLYAEKRRKEKIQMKQKIRAHEERNVKSNEAPEPATDALPAYLLDRSNEKNAKALSLPPSSRSVTKRQPGSRFPCPRSRVFPRRKCSRLSRRERRRRRRAGSV
jgi:ribosome biogenesis protein NSA2